MHRETADLDLRRTPLQVRGQVTFERILDATAQLLDEAGADAVTTNLIARAAGVNVATLYQYFPNKQAVLLALFHRQSDQRVETVRRCIVGMGRSTEWTRMLDAAIDALAELHRSTPGGVALRQAMRSSHELLAHELQDSVNTAQPIANELQSASRTPANDARLVAVCAVEILTSLLDRCALESRNWDDRVVDQLKRMLRAYLAPSLPVPPARRRRA
jgi:AcrR family transcriptional regulator